MRYVAANRLATIGGKDFLPLVKRSSAQSASRPIVSNLIKFDLPIKLMMCSFMSHKKLAAGAAAVPSASPAVGAKVGNPPAPNKGEFIKMSRLLWLKIRCLIIFFTFS